MAFFALVFFSSAIALGWLLVGRRNDSLVGHLQEARSEIEDGQFASFVPEPSLSGPITLENDTRFSLTPPLPSKLTFEVIPPPEAFLEFSVGLLSRREVKRAKVEFRVTLEADGKRVVVYREILRRFQLNRWHKRRVDLTRWSEKPVSLTLEVRPVFGNMHRPWAERVLVAWGDPVLSSRLRQGWLQQGFAWARAFFAPAGPQAKLKPHPSILFILVDTLRADYLGCYGFRGNISPGLDRLVAESLRFEHCFSQAPWTKPSMATLFTSLYPGVHGLTNHEGKFWGGRTSGMKTGVLPQEAVTLAELLRRAGYRTAAFIGNPLLAPIYGFDQGFEVYEVYEVHSLSYVLMDAAKAWLESRPRGEPFFVYLHFMDVHGPYDAPQEDYEELKESPSFGTKRRLSEQEYGAIPEYLKGVPWARQPEQQELTAWRARYAAGVKEFDRRLSSFLEELRGSGLLDESFVVLTSDHGEEFLEHGGWDHGHGLCGHQLHVPLLIRKPGAQHGGREVENLVSLIDLMPTLVSVAGVDAPPDLQGRDLSFLLDQEELEDSPASFGAATSDRPGLHAMRTRRHQFIMDLASGQTLLFDLGADPGEEHDIAARQPGVTTELRSRLMAHLAEMADHGTLERRVAPLPEGLIERLRALGYLK